MDLNSETLPNTEKTKLTVLHFAISDYRFCIDISYIKQLVDLVFLQTVPGTPIYFKGLMNFHGQEIPVIDLATYLNISNKDQYDLN
ncbi:MAG: chemotaxis protein CheW, partial [Gammaproteobacteria bacterium]|nr:chemotaxis protein CheW [Gammaproteobacteria bacterium]